MQTFNLPGREHRMAESRDHTRHKRQRLVSEMFLCKAFGYALRVQIEECECGAVRSGSNRAGWSKWEPSDA